MLLNVLCNLFYRCANCYDCPSCGTALAVRATAVPISSTGSSPGSSTSSDQGQGKSPSAKKMHYLKCPFCSWSSRDVGIPDQATGKLTSCSSPFIVEVVLYQSSWLTALFGVIFPINDKTQILKSC